MKKIFLITAILIFTSFELYSQSGNSCDEAIAITAGTYTLSMELTVILLTLIVLNMMRLMVN